MKYIAAISFLAILFFASCSQVSRKKPVDYVSPNLGSHHARWFFYTPAAIPFGMAKLAPHTNAYGSPGGWFPCGYSDSHTSIEGFGHFHEFQVGGLVVMPTTGMLQTVPGSLENPDEGYRSRFDKKDELAEAGYYSVILKDYRVKAELTYEGRNLGNGKYDLAYFIKLGYVPNYEYRLSNGWVFIFGASHSLEYCFNSYAVGQFAKALGKTEDYEKLTRLAGNYRLLYNPGTRFIQPRETDGSFIEDFDEMVAWKGFQEGNAFQYTWYVPHDVKGLIGLHGSNILKTSHHFGKIRERIDRP